MNPLTNFSIFNPASLQRTLETPGLDEKLKTKLCAQAFDSLLLTKVLEKALDSPFKDDTSKTMAGQTIYSSLTAQVLAHTLTQEGGLKLADPSYFSTSSALSLHE